MAWAQLGAQLDLIAGHLDPRSFEEQVLAYVLHHLDTSWPDHMRTAFRHWLEPGIVQVRAATAVIGSTFHKPDELLQLEHLGQLAVLSLPRAGLDDLELICRSPACSNLRILDVRNNELDARCLWQSSSSGLWASVEHLCLRGNPLGAGDSVEALLHTAPGPQLRALDLRDCGLAYARDELTAHFGDVLAL